MAGLVSGGLRSPVHVALVGQSPMEYVFGSRMRRAEDTGSAATALPVAAVAAQVGYGSESALSAAFVRYSGTDTGA
jgi:transcriptional regulator GlxA family with amidase domain